MVVSCCGVDVDFEAEAADVICEALCGAGRVAAGEVCGAQVLIEGSVCQHVISGGQDRGGFTTLPSITRRRQATTVSL